jgi:hypothetical protein
MKTPVTKKFNCSNCKQADRLKAADFPEPGNHYLCKECGLAYFNWCQKSFDNIWVEGAPGEPSFLRSNMAKTARKSKSHVKKV